MNKTNFFEEFQEVSSKGWKQKIQSDLKGADYTNTLVWESLEGIPVKPFYHADDLENLARPSINSPQAWKIGQVIFAANAKKANSKALDALERGAESLIFAIPSEDIDISLVLKGIDMQQIPIHFNLEFLSPNYIKSIREFTGNISTNLNIDIIGCLAKTGNWYLNQKEDVSNISNILAQNSTASVLGVNMALYQNAGANLVQQLAYGMAHANEYLNWFAGDGGSAERPPHITFKVAMGGNYFFEIAKLRALRVLWKSLAAAYQVTGDCHIMALPGRRNKTLYDYNNNMLRTTMENMASVLGGADTVCNLSYDAIYHKDNEFGERMARNQLLILKNEAYLDKVTNPADGAYYLERITSQLGEKALKLFKYIESGGGFIRQLKEGTIQKKIRENAQKEQQIFNEGKEVLVGTNAYQNRTELMKNELELHPFVKRSQRKTLVEPIIERRLAETLEQARLENE
jgi:methylmalonyl-CoA mutase